MPVLVCASLSLYSVEYYRSLARAFSTRAVPSIRRDKQRYLLTGQHQTLNEQQTDDMAVLETLTEVMSTIQLLDHAVKLFGSPGALVVKALGLKLQVPSSNHSYCQFDSIVI